LVVMVPGMGDDIQAIKAGILEIGDLFVVNKADRPDAARLQADVASMLGEAGSRAGTYLVSAEEGRGIGALADGLEILGARDGASWQERRRRMIEEEVRDAILEEASRRLRGTLAGLRGPDAPVAAVLDGRLSVEEAASRVVQEICRRG